MRSAIALNVMLGQEVSLTAIGLDRPNQLLAHQYFADRTPPARINRAA